jgi:hypothetical protein
MPNLEKPKALYRKARQENRKAREEKIGIGMRAGRAFMARKETRAFCAARPDPSLAKRERLRMTTSSQFSKNR